MLLLSPRTKQKSIARGSWRSNANTRCASMRCELVIRPKDPNDPNPSPEYQMFAATGLNNSRDISDLLEALRNTRPLLRPAINSHNKMLAKGTRLRISTS